MNFTLTLRKALIALAVLIPAVLIPAVLLALMFGEYAHLVLLPVLAVLGTYLAHDEPELNGGEVWPLDARKRRFLAGLDR